MSAGLKAEAARQVEQVTARLKAAEQLAAQAEARASTAESSSQQSVAEAMAAVQSRAAAELQEVRENADQIVQVMQSTTQQEVVEANQKLSEVTQKLSQARAESAASSQQLTAAKQQLDAAQQQLSAIQKQHSSATSQADERQAVSLQELNTLRQNAQAAESANVSQLAEVRARLEKSEAAAGAASARADSAEAEAEAEKEEAGAHLVSFCAHASIRSCFKFSCVQIAQQSAVHCIAALQWTPVSLLGAHAHVNT